MTSLSDHQSSSYTKLLYLGDSGTGKTGSLVSLIKAGYKLRILDWDNGLDALRGQISEQCPDLMSAVDYETLRDRMKSTPLGPKRIAKAWVRSTNLLNKWSDDTIPAEWGPDTVFVFDSTTWAGKAALAWAESQNPEAKDPRNWYHSAQTSFLHVIDSLTDEEFHCNVIVIAHIKYEERDGEPQKGYPTAVGSALGPILGGGFNTVIQAESRRVGTNIKRTIRTIPSATVDLKNPVPFRLSAEYDLNTGLATLFEQLRK